VTTTSLARIEQLKELNAFATIVADQALERARQAENEIQHGRWRGPLHGVPVGIKDFCDTATVRTTAAFERLNNRIPKRDAVAVAKLKDAGAIVGK
jgi:aspartyl-tRNA(Asn)/glutamyl-tRNA(Gln) amidotransferase subunit A